MKELLQCAESQETASRLSIASGSALFERAIRSLPVTADLFQSCLEHSDAREAMVDRFLELVSYNIDLRYRHPYDIALAIYLWVMDALDQYLPHEQHIGKAAASVALRLGHNCSWAARVAHGIQSGAEYDEQATSIDYGEIYRRDAPIQAEEMQIRVSDPALLRGRLFGSWSFVWLGEKTKNHEGIEQITSFPDSDVTQVRIGLSA